MELPGHTTSFDAYQRSEAPTEAPPPSSTMLPPPSFRVAAVASLAGLRDSCGNVPLDSCVLVRTTNDIPAAAAVNENAASVLLEVNGVLSLSEIATKTNLSLPDTIGAFLDLLGLGVVDELRSSDEVHEVQS
jgi:hypothetical protein